MSVFDKINNLLTSVGNKYKEQPTEPIQEQPKESTMQAEMPAEPIEPQTAVQSEKQSAPETSPKAEPETKEPRKEEKRIELESKDDLLKSIISTLDRLVEDKDFTKGKILNIWLNADQFSFANYSNDMYRHRVLATLVNERDYCFDDIKFTIGKPTEDLHAICIGGNELEYMEVLDNIPVVTTTSSKAMICVFGGAGSLLQDQYLLSSDEMKARGIAAYNIGSGQFPKIPTGFRENHIAIDDNPDSPQAEKNKYVSRMHAHIGFSETFGFYLQVEKDGTRLMGKRTRIFREGDRIECDNPLVKIPLQSGDMIELGKAVVLLFSVIKK